jgi:hypothetical protein
MSGTWTARRPHVLHCIAFATHGSWGADRGRCRSRSMSREPVRCTSAAESVRMESKMADRPKCCAACQQPLPSAGSGLPDAIQCVRSHFVCHACVCDFVMPVQKHRPADCGLAYACPECPQRELMFLNGLHMIALVKRNWDTTTACFDHEGDAMGWLTSAPRPSAPPPPAGPVTRARQTASLRSHGVRRRFHV